VPSGIGGYGPLPASVMLRQERPMPSLAPAPPSIGQVGPSESGGAQAVHGPSFSARVSELLETTAGLGNRADAAAEGLLNGEHQDVHGTMIAMQESDVAFRLVTTVRNRVVEAYREVMRMGA
jgi:flagellar hook-basal body complex protein FliE